MQPSASCTNPLCVMLRRQICCWSRGIPWCDAQCEQVTCRTATGSAWEHSPKVSTTVSYACSWWLPLPLANTLERRTAAEALGSALSLSAGSRYYAGYVAKIDMVLASWLPVEGMTAGLCVRPYQVNDRSQCSSVGMIPVGQKQTLCRLSCCDSICIAGHCSCSGRRELLRIAQQERNWQGCCLGGVLLLKLLVGMPEHVLRAVCERQRIQLVIFVVWQISTRAGRHLQYITLCSNSPTLLKT